MHLKQMPLLRGAFVGRGTYKRGEGILSIFPDIRGAFIQGAFKERSVDSMRCGISLVCSINLLSNKFFLTIEELNYDNPNAEALFKVIFLDFAHYEEKETVIGIRENRIYTILSKKIDDAYTGDNGAYLKSRGTKIMYHVDTDKNNMTVLSHVVHQEGGAYYCNQCFGDRAYERVVLPENEIYFLEHYYREDKRTPG